MSLSALKNIKKLASVVTNISGRASSTKIVPLAKGLSHVEESKIREKIDASALAKFKFEIKGFHKYGLLEDDIWNELEWDVEEAVRRLPLRIKQERDYRQLRAIQANMQNQVLPEELWTKVDDDHHYLEPYVQEVRREREEIEDWEKTH